MGYYVYLGTTNGSYFAKVDVGTNTSATLANLSGRSTTYYFAATAYNSNRLESPPSNQAQFTTSSNAGPSLASISSKFAAVNTVVVVTNGATDSDLPPRQLTYSLDPGAPTTMNINPANGRIYWKPTIADGGTTNNVTVRVNDGGTPNLYSTKTFAVVVSNAAQVSLGNAVSAQGQTVTVPLTVVATSPVTNLSFILNAPSNTVGNLTISNLMPTIVSITQSTPGAARSTVTIRAFSGQMLTGTQTVAQITFTALANKPSSFSPLSIVSPNATQMTGQTMPSNIGIDGEAVLVGAESLLRAVLKTNGQRDMVLYGPNNNRFVIESSTNPKATNGWVTELTSSTMSSNLTQSFPNFTTNRTVRFYRARSL